MRFEPALLDEIRRRVTLSDVVGRRVRLKRSGREFCGLSPFKPERTPSFFVNDQKGFYHCFASGQHGDVFAFLMEAEGLDFPAAVAEAADLAGVTLPERPAPRQIRRVPQAEVAAVLRAKGILGPARALGLPLRDSGGRLTGACPSCGGGPTAGRFEVRAEGFFACAVCQVGGDAIRLVRLVKACGFVEALDYLKSLPDRTDEPGADRSDEFRERERRRLFALWREAAPAAGSAVEAYFAVRGLVLPPTRALRFVAALPYFHGMEPDPRDPAKKRPRQIFCGPAMIAALVAPDPMSSHGRFRGLHLTWLDLGAPKGKAAIADPATGELLPAKKMRGSKKGAHIDLVVTPGACRMVAGEGIETVAAVFHAESRAGRATGTGYRVAGDMGNLGGKATETVPHPSAKTPAGRRLRVPGPVPDLAESAMTVPDGITELVLLGDGDSDPFTTRLVLDRACRRHARPGRTCRQAWPPQGVDFDDLARGQPVQGLHGFDAAEREGAPA
jgi:hypothetical protein